MKAWFAGLQPRERLVFVGGVVAAAVILSWLLVLKPMRAATVELRDSVATKERLLVDLARVDGLATTQGRVTDTARRSLVVLVDETAGQFGLKFPGTRVDDATRIQVTVEDAQFDALVDWLVSLSTDHAVTIERANFSKTTARGVVDGRVYLFRP